jgi:hypothetical protein
MQVSKTAVKVTKSTPMKAKTDAVKRKEVTVKTSPISKFLARFSKKTNTKPKSKLTKKAQLERKLARRNTIIRGIIGIGLLLTVVSIARSTFIALQFVDGTANIIFLAPQVLFAAIISIIVFIIAILNLHK